MPTSLSSGWPINIGMLIQQTHSLLHHPPAGEKVPLELIIAEHTIKGVNSLQDLPISLRQLDRRRALEAFIHR
jgi:hypothetical protein